MENNTQEQFEEKVEKVVALSIKYPDLTVEQLEQLADDSSEDKTTVSELPVFGVVEADEAELVKTVLARLSQARAAARRLQRMEEPRRGPSHDTFFSLLAEHLKDLEGDLLDHVDPETLALSR